MNACAPYVDPLGRPQIIPAPDTRDVAPCYDPGVEGTYSQALRANRVALAECKRKQANLVGFIRDLHALIGQP